MDAPELIGPLSPDGKSCDMFAGINVDDWAAIYNHATTKKALVAAAVDRVLKGYGVFTFLPDLLQDSNHSSVMHLRGCSEVFADLLAAAT